MKSKCNLLIISPNQFGYLTDTLKYCQYSRDSLVITYLCWDYDYNKVEMEGVVVKYVSRKGKMLSRNFRLLKCANNEIRNGNYDVIFVNYFKGISLLRILNLRRKFMLDIRSVVIDKSENKRRLFNFLLLMESLFFKNITVISKNVANQLKIRNCSVIPVGAEPIGNNLNKINDNIHLIYVGTLQNRDIIKCVQGFHQYIVESNDSKATFTIIGDSPKSELNEIKKYIIDHELSNQVLCLGRINHERLGGYFENANVGVSFIPMTKYFNFQPPTKTLEYLISGLPVIATKTDANNEIILDNKNCILINDLESEFAKAVSLMKLSIRNTDFRHLSSLFDNYNWRNVVENSFLPLVEDFCKKGALKA